KWDATSADGIAIVTSGGRSPEGTNRKYPPEDVWAYQPLRRPPIPLTGDGPHPIDAFLRATQKEKGIQENAPPAHKRTLIRRATLDLTGLLPTPEEVDAFLKDDSPDAYPHLIERLLQSPHYGERWAQHWLDVVRYADTAGFSNDFERPNSWRYRDYVVRSFNADKPFDRFVTEQIAGDELNADDPEMQIAVGFLRMGPWEHTGMTVAAITRQQFLDDVTNHVGVSLLGQGLRCAACHDHKFDPVPTRDYYRMQAIFSPVQFVEAPVPFLARENVSGFDSAKALVQQRLEQLEAAQAALRQKNRDAVASYLVEKNVKS